MLIASIIVYAYFSNTVTVHSVQVQGRCSAGVGQALQRLSAVKILRWQDRMIQIVSPKQGAIIESKLKEFMVEWQIQQESCKNCILKISIRSLIERVQYVKNYVKYSNATVSVNFYGTFSLTLELLSISTSKYRKRGIMSWRPVQLYFLSCPTILCTGKSRMIHLPETTISLC